MFRQRVRLLRLVLSVIILILATTIIAPVSAQDDVIHVVQPGENLFRIALRYGVDMNLIAEANNITNVRQIFSGQQLVIPGLSTPDASPVVENPLVAGTPITHVVARGEYLNAIATRYGVTVEQILQANNIPNVNRIYPGQVLTIWTPDSVNVVNEAAITEAATTPLPEAAPSTRHIVQRGEHLSQIAAIYGLSWPAIAQANGITNPDHIYAGQELIIPAGGLATNPTSTINSDPGATIFTGRQIVVDLSDSMIYAYENGELVNSVLVSTGLAATPTVQGDFTVYLKLDAQTMTGPGYYLPDVPWVMYFYQGYAIHGTYWHSNFGRPMSHGCVNLPTPDAAWFYQFAEVGTPVRVQY